MPTKKFDKYAHYENSVQTPHEHAKAFDEISKELSGKKALALREDFCGTFLISCAWVKSDPERTALGLDLDQEPTRYGLKNGYQKLKPQQKKRIQIKNQDVCIPTSKKFDVIGACNFSFNVFHSEKILRKYFKAAYASLVKKGVLILEVAGGPGFIRTQREQKTYSTKKLGKFTYYWDQKSYDPIHEHGTYAIHFKDKNGTLHRGCFTYDWRVWSIPELKYLLKECGFKDVVVYWEASNQHGHGTGEFVKMSQGDNAYSWIAFVVGIK